VDDQHRQMGAPRGGPRRPRLSRRGFLLLGGAVLAGLIGVLRLEQGDAKPQQGVATPEQGGAKPQQGGGQRATSGPLSPSHDFPVLSVEGGPPAVAPQDWVLSVDGLVDEPLRLDRAAWLALPRTQVTTDLQCVDGWTVNDLRWEGVRVGDLLHRVALRPEGQYVSFHAYGGAYANSLTLTEALAPEALLADSLDGAPLPAAHGGPLRLVIPTQFGYRNVKWVARVEVGAQPHDLP
jgi:DMSO/TMAO reductase YedYZ molybdopterin-dependent catalytic subunit